MRLSVVVVVRLRQKTNAPMAKPAKTSSATMPMPAPAPADKPPFEAAAVPERELLVATPEVPPLAVVDGSELGGAVVAFVPFSRYAHM